MYIPITKMSDTSITVMYHGMSLTVLYIQEHRTNCDFLLHRAFCKFPVITSNF